MDVTGFLPQKFTALVTGGELPAPELFDAVLSRASLIVAADSGFDSCIARGVSPQIVLGDFDSIAAPLSTAGAEGRKLIHVARDKDFSDTELGIKVAFESSNDKLVLLGGGGGRADHFLGILSVFKSTAYPSVWLTASELVLPLEEELNLRHMAERTVSIYPIVKPCYIDSTGLVWNLDRDTFTENEMSLSNRIVGSLARLEPKRGRALVFLPYN